MRIGKSRGCSAPSGPTPSRSPSSCRRPTSPARCTSATRSTITLQDILVRHERMQGKDALWVVGTDHAGIATQMVVERNLESQRRQAHRHGPRGLRRQGLGVEGASGGRSPASCAASARRATGRTSASPWTRAFRAPSLKVFVELYKRGLLYRDKRLVNWDPSSRPRSATSRSRRARCRASSGTSLSARRRQRRDITSPPRGPRRCSPTWRSRCIPTTSATRRWSASRSAADHRPPDPDHRRRACRSGARLGRGQDHAGPRLQRFRGRQARRLQARRDAQHARRAANVVQTAGRADPDELIGLDRFEARKRVVELLEPRARWRRSRTAPSPTPYGDRSGVVIEPWLTDQWYVDAATLAEAGDRGGALGRDQDRPRRPGRRPGSTGSRTSSPGASRASSGGATRSRPGTTDGKVFVVAEKSGETRGGGASAKRRRRRSCAATRTCSTPGSPRRCGRSRRSAGPSRPRTSSAITPTTCSSPASTSSSSGTRGWRCRGIEFMGEVPWKTLYLHGLVRDAQGPEDVQVEGQYGRSARPDRQIRRRRAALHAGGDGKPGPRHQAR
jgi:valyl-tRNA synthetase